MSDIQQNLTVAKRHLAVNFDRPMVNQREAETASAHALLAIAEALSEINDRERRRDERQALEG